MKKLLLPVLGIIALTYTPSITALNGRFTASGSTPSVANVGANSCGTTAATIAGNDNAGEITVGNVSGTQCRITFTSAAPVKWQCVISNTITANLARGVPVDTTHLDLVGTFVGGDVLAYICVPR